MIFLFAEILLYISFITMDIMDIPSVWVKYISICLCFIAAFLHFIKTRRRFIVTVMAFTLLADTFLLLLDTYYILGVLSFCVVQTLYAAYMISLSGNKSIIPRTGLFISAVIILITNHLADVLSIASIWSFTQLFINVFHAFLIRKKHANGSLFAAGLLLFLMCDTCVGLSNITMYIPAFSFTGISFAANYLMWIFYLPSQVLITYSFCKEARSL